MHWVVFYTDGLFYLLLALGMLFAWLSYRREHLRLPWRQVWRSPVGVASGLILLVYASIGTLDSVHLRPVGAESGAVISLLDWLLTPLRTHQERSYAAPFATHGFSQETRTLDSGETERDYPRLQWGGCHLADPEQDFWPDVAQRSAMGLIGGLVLWGLLLALLVDWRARQARLDRVALALLMLKGRAGWPYRTLALTAGVLLLLAGLLVALAPHYPVLGTDKVGEDVLYQSLKSVRTGLLIGTLTTLIMLPAALLLGILAGYFRGWVDDLIQYLYTTLNSIPGVLLIAAAVLMLDIHMSNNPGNFQSLAERADVRLLFLCLILGITSWTGLCRLLRGETLKLRDMEYVQAALALGVSQSRILWRHILPNLMHLVLISIALDFSGLVLAEAVLSYINIGVDPSMNSWGNMINHARLELAREPVVWWSLTAAFLMMFTLVLAANLFADVVRDAFDPRLRHHD